MVVYGKVDFGEAELETRDAIGISETETFSAEAKEDTSLLFIEVPMHF